MELELELEKRLIQACNGRSYGQGGLNKDHLLDIIDKYDVPISLSADVQKMPRKELCYTIAKRLKLSNVRNVGLKSKIREKKVVAKAAPAVKKMAASKGQRRVGTWPNEDEVTYYQSHEWIQGILGPDGGNPKRWQKEIGGSCWMVYLPKEKKFQISATPKKYRACLNRLKTAMKEMETESKNVMKFWEKVMDRELGDRSWADITEEDEAMTDEERREQEDRWWTEALLSAARLKKDLDVSKIRPEIINQVRQERKKK